MNEEKKRILKMLEKGLINAEEAEELLETLAYAENVEQSTDLSTKVDWEKHSNEKKTYENNSSIKSNIFNFVEETITKIKNVDLDFNFGKYEEVSHIFQQKGVAPANIDLDIANGSMEVKPWKENDVRVECRAKVYQVENREEAKQKFMQEINYQIDQDSLIFALPSKKIKLDLTLFIPEIVYNRLSLRMFNGNIIAEKLTVEDCKVKSSNGKVMLSQMEGKDWEIETANGKIELDKITCEECDVESVSGSIHIKGDFGKLDVQNVNGSITHLAVGDKLHTAFYRTTTGGINLEMPTGKHIDGELTTSLGNLQCDLSDMTIHEEKKEMMKKYLRFETNQHGENMLHIEAQTKTGTVHVTER